MAAFGRVCGAVLLVCGCWFVLATWHWPLVGDAALLHYIAFLAGHGTPYRDIVDLNFPGALAANALVLRLFGPGDLPWRLYDFALLAAIAGACFMLCPRKLGALYAAVVFALLHGRDGLIQTGQRDLLVAALLAWACAFAVAARERQARHWGLLAGLCVGAAATVKPVALLLFLVLPARPRRLILGSGGLPVCAAFAYLLHAHTLRAFLTLESELAPYHASLFRIAPLRLVAESVSSVLLSVFAAWLALFLWQKRWRNFPEQIMLAGFGFGIVSFYVQGRGYPYHRYPSEVCLLLLAGTAFTAPETRGQKLLAFAGLAFGVCVIVPKSLWAVTRFTPEQDPFRQALTADLSALGSPLTGKVQCLDMAGGCIATLYHAQLTQATGYLYDCYLYPAKPTTYLAERDRYRAAFAKAFTAAHPELVVATSDECGPADSRYTKLTRWPWLASTLAGEYTLLREYRPTTLQSWGGKPALPYGYRIYRRKTPETIQGWLPPPSASTSAPLTAPSPSHPFPARSR